MNSNDFLDEKVDKMLNQLEIMDEQFKFYTQESERIDAKSLEIDYMNLPEEEKNERQKKLNRQIAELFARYKKDTDMFDKLLVEIDQYFLSKYNINFNLKEHIYGLEKN